MLLFFAAKNAVSSVGTPAVARGLSCNTLCEKKQKGGPPQRGMLHKGVDHVSKAGKKTLQLLLSERGPRPSERGRRSEPMCVSLFVRPTMLLNLPFWWVEYGRKNPATT